MIRVLQHEFRINNEKLIIMQRRATRNAMRNPKRVTRNIEPGTPSHLVLRNRTLNLPARRSEAEDGNFQPAFATPSNLVLRTSFFISQNWNFSPAFAQLV
jgi:hypothetical protein